MLPFASRVTGCCPSFECVFRDSIQSFDTVCPRVFSDCFFSFIPIVVQRVGRFDLRFDSMGGLALHLKIFCWKDKNTRTHGSLCFLLKRYKEPRYLEPLLKLVLLLTIISVPLLESIPFPQDFRKTNY